MAESEPPKPKPRPIVRIGIFLISHSVLLSVVFCTAGVLGLFLVLVLAKNLYFSENALMPGSAHPMLSSQDVSEANEFVKEITNLSLKPEGTGIRITGLIAQHMADLGAEVSYHKFHPLLNKFHPLHFFSGPESRIIQENCSCSSIGINAVGIIRAPQGDGKESIVLVTPYNSVNMSHDSQHGEYASVAARLRDYHTPLFGGLAKVNAEMCHESSYLYDLKQSPATGAEVSDVFRRAGTMAAALVIKVADRNGEVERGTLRIYAEASNGQMPNLDLVNIVNYLAVQGQGLRVKVKKLWSA
ncbi:Glycosylphosphatidylinositol anchor attachment 1 protein [Actinidia chinensis var. chinensis]|uniref:Glycosylphosphatidylinositol anchor attachment 1 protein n=1 Tax=Actinidia chinensis var. chinensis TaxID=1590841 RepID=A0A2R6RTQ3_ACTCC|nr:Glycosylphosphatidylinositol anchor attachment 1 protein [Actinidia chinensis var. chinensis]